jgi:hypothetical protein
MVVPLGGAVVVHAGMTHAQARNAVAAVWSYVDLQFFSLTPAFFKDGPCIEDAATADTDVLLASPAAEAAGTDSMLIVGSHGLKQVEDAIEFTFGIAGLFYPRFGALLARPYVDSLNALQTYCARAAQAFAAAHGTEPTNNDSFDGLDRALFASSSSHHQHPGA